MPKGRRFSETLRCLPWGCGRMPRVQVGTAPACQGSLSLYWVSLFWWKFAEVLPPEGWEQVKWKSRSWFYQDHLGFSILADSLLPEMITDCIWRGEGKSDLNRVHYLSANNAVCSCEEWKDCSWHCCSFSYLTFQWELLFVLIFFFLFTHLCPREISIITTGGRGTCGMCTVGAPG